MFHAPVTVSLDLPAGLSYEDLSTGEMRKGGTIELKPFQLRSFLFPKKKVEVKNLQFTGTDKNVVLFYRKRIAELKAAANLLAKDKIDVSMENKDLAHLEKMLAGKRFAELYRVAFSRRMNQLLKKIKNRTALIRQQQFMDKGHYAVNCGSTEFYEAPGGKFFFPDQKFDGKYGYVGQYTSIGRDVTGISGTGLPELYKTEAYSLNGYRFMLPNGTYKAVFYLKSGFQPNFQPGQYRFSILANGKTILDKIDLHKLMNGDFNRALKLEVNGIRVTNGELMLKWRHEPTGKKQNNSVCLANAIEIIKQ